MSVYRQILHFIKSKHWYVLAPWYLRNYVRGFEFQVNIGEAKPKYCRCFRYGKFEAEVINKLCNALRANGMVEDDIVQSEDLVYLAAKHYQANVPYSHFMWRLCIYYIDLNVTIRIFKFMF